MRRTELDGFEQQIEDEADRFVPVVGEERDRVDQIVAKSRTSRNINIRISEHDLHQVKRRADREGLPYQTLICSILRKYVSDQLVDERVISKTLQLMSRERG